MTETEDQSADDEKPPKAVKAPALTFLQKVVVTVVGPALLVVVTAWANYRFDVSEKKSDDTQAAVGDLNTTISNLEKLLESAKAHDTEVRQQSRTDLANLRMIVLRLEGLVQQNAVREEVQRRTKTLFDRLGKDFKSPKDLRIQRDKVLNTLVTDLKMDAEINKVTEEALLKRARLQFDEMVKQHYGGGLGDPSSGR